MVPHEVCHSEEIIDGIKEELAEGKILFVKIDNRLKNIEDVLLQVKEQTTKTNGRVTKLEGCISTIYTVGITTIVLLLGMKLGIFDIILKLI